MAFLKTPTGMDVHIVRDVNVLYKVAERSDPRIHPQVKSFRSLTFCNGVTDLVNFKFVWAYLSLKTKFIALKHENVQLKNNKEGNVLVVH